MVYRETFMKGVAPEARLLAFGPVGGVKADWLDVIIFQKYREPISLRLCDANAKINDSFTAKNYFAYIIGIPKLLLSNTHKFLERCRAFLRVPFFLIFLRVPAICLSHTCSPSFNIWYAIVSNAHP